MVNELCVFQIGPAKDGEHRIIIAPRNQEDAIDASLPEGEFIDCWRTLYSALDGKAEIRLGNELLHQFICDAIEEPSSWNRENLQNVFTETIRKYLNKK